MEILRRSPMLAVLASLVAGAGLYDKLGVWAFVVVVPVIFAGVMFLTYEREIPGQWRFFAFTMIFTLLCSWRMYAVISSPPAENVVFVAEEGTVTDVREWGRIYALVVETESRGKYAAFSHFADFMKGTRIKFDGATRAFRPKRNNRDFDEGRFWRGRDVNGLMTMYNAEELPQKFSMALMRHKLSRKLTIYTPNLTSSYLKAAWIGDRDKSLNDKHRLWGTSHLLAVSGFHVGVVMMLMMFYIGRKTLILTIILWAYIFLTGAAPSAMRAGLMIQIWLCAGIFGRKSEAVNSVACAGVILLMYSPFLFWDIGFRLSVISALTISAMIEAGYSWLMISPAVGLVTFPQVAYTFGGVPVVGVILNLFAPMYFTFAFTIASFGAFMRLINFPLSNYFMMTVEGIFILWEKIAGTFADVIPYILRWNYFTAWTGCGVLIFFVCRYLDLAPLRIAAVMSVVSFAAFAVFL